MDLILQNLDNSIHFYLVAYMATLEQILSLKWTEHVHVKEKFKQNKRIRTVPQNIFRSGSPPLRHPIYIIFLCAILFP